MSPEIESEDQLLAINYTSGTTGRPKGVMYHHRGAYLNAIGEVLESGLRRLGISLDPADVSLQRLVLYLGRYRRRRHACLSAGGGPRGYFPADPPGRGDSSVRRPDCSDRHEHLAGGSRFQDTPAPKIMTAGAPPAPTIIRNMEAIGAEITHTYGLTEVYGPHSVCAWQPEWEDNFRRAESNPKSRQGVPYIVTHFMDVVEPLTMQPVPGTAGASAKWSCGATMS